MHKLLDIMQNDHSAQVVRYSLFSMMLLHAHKKLFLCFAHMLKPIQLCSFL